jgi:hypothetical protein
MSVLRTCLMTAAGLLVIAGSAHAGDEPPHMRSQSIGSYVVPEANQAVAVDAEHFYAIDNRTIAKYDKKTQKLVQKWERPKDGPIKHFDSAVVVDGKIYLAHSNYPDWPMASSLEIFDAATLTHVATHSFGIQIGSFTWVDKGPDGSWYGGFANYNRVFDKSQMAYGNKYNTQIVRFDADWQPIEQWTIPDAVVEKFEDMSNSGGSWGPDGKLYLSGHDPAEAYVMQMPAMGPVLDWVATVPLDNHGQGIAWDRSQKDVIYAIIRGEGDEPNRVTVNRVMFDAK